MKNPALRYFEGWARRYDRDMQAYAYAEPDLLFTAIKPYLPETGTLLDAGCGTGLSSMPFQALRPQLHITGIDGSAAMLAQARARNVMDVLAQADAETAPLPFDNASFDIVIAAGVLEYVSDAHTFLQNLTRVLKSDGVIAISFEPKASQVLYKRGLWSGILHDVPELSVVQRLMPRTLWPRTYRKYLYAPDFIAACVAQAGLTTLSSREFTAYRWSQHELIAHHLVIARNAL